MKGLIFCIIDFSLELKCGKLPAKAGQNRTLTSLPKPLVVMGELQCDLHKNDLPNKKTYFNRCFKVFGTVYKV